MKKRLTCLGVALALAAFMSAGAVLAQGRPAEPPENSFVCALLNLFALPGSLLELLGCL